MKPIDIVLILVILVLAGLAWRFRKSSSCCGNCEQCGKYNGCNKAKKPVIKKNK